MQQTIVSVVLPVPPEQVDTMNTAIDTMRAALAGPANDFAMLRAALPTLHFMSIVLFDRNDGVPQGGLPATPLLVLEANVDGTAGPFWAALEAAIGPYLRDLFRLCAPPRGRFDELFLAVTAPGSRAPLAPLLERQSVFPAASHAGNRGLSRNRIMHYNALFVAAQAALPPPPAVLEQGVVGIHDWLRKTLLPKFAWLDEPCPPPISDDDHSADQRRLLMFAAVAAFGAVLPWLLLAAIFHRAPVTALALFVGAFCASRLHDIGDLFTLLGKPRQPDAWWIIGAALLAAEVFPVFLAPRGMLSWVVLVIAGLVSGALILLAVLRTRELADPELPEAVPNAAKVRALQAWEDCHSDGSDHMASVVIIKPGRLRAFLIRFGLTAVNLAVRYTATDGYLGSMRTIHFAHWAIVDGGRRLLFFSNFDGSWESYLDDFIEKAHAGLTLAWGNCLGFPAMRYLCLDGATQGRKFKNWARCSMTESRFWYAAYPDLTVNQVVRQAAVATGLASPRLAAAHAAAWARNL